MTRSLIIDTDSHITEPPDVWTSRVPRKWRERVPHVVGDEHGRDVWLLDDVKIMTLGHTATVGWPDMPNTEPGTLADCHPGAYDATARLKYLDEAGLWAQVLYPNVAGFGSQRFLDIPERDLQLACVRAYNDFLVEWCSADPNRLIPIMSIPFWDSEACVAEVERCANLGFRGILFTGEPQRFGLPLLGDTAWDPVWNVATDTGLPLHFHIGAGEDTPNAKLLTPERLETHGQAATAAYVTADLFLKNGVQVSDLISCGVLARFPELRFVTVESGIGWVPFILEAADFAFSTIRRGERVRGSDLLPSELFRRQVYATYWFEKVAPSRLIGPIPANRILFETDFPHTACLYGDIPTIADESLADASPEVKRMILWDNAAELYHIQEPSLSAPANN